MVSHICLLVEVGLICNSMAASLCFKSCEDHSLIKSYNGDLWKNNYRPGTFAIFALSVGCQHKHCQFLKPLSGILFNYLKKKDH